MSALLQYFYIPSASNNVVNLKKKSNNPSAKKNDSLPLYFYHQLAYLNAKGNHSSL